jgi:hypothetical protein
MLRMPGKTPAAPRRWLAIALLLTAGWRSLCAQQATPATPVDAETVKALLQRVQDLESEVRVLKSQVETLAGAKTVPPASPQVATAATPAAPDTVDSMAGHAARDVSGPRLQIRGYGDVSGRADDQKGDTNVFALGQLNLFMTSRLTDKASFLAETVIEADSATNEFGIEPERILLLYSVRDWLNLSIGRYHTAIGYHNNAYHHSALMQTTLERPFLFAFEDKGGILPIHNVGVSATGVISNRLGLHYVAEVGNGRSGRPLDVSNPVQNVTDDNNGKAFNLAAFVRPSALPGLQFGFSGYRDHVTPPAQAKVTEDIFAAHVIYQNSRFELLNEAVLLRHSAGATPVTDNISSFYSQISRRWGNYRPYFRYEYMNVPQTDPLYSSVGLLHGPKGGLRYELSEFTAFKLEYGRDMRRGLPSVNRIGSQLAFEF